jgi:hypothetical protein
VTVRFSSFCPLPPECDSSVLIRLWQAARLVPGAADILSHLRHLTHLSVNTPTAEDACHVLSGVKLRSRSSGMTACHLVLLLARAVRTAFQHVERHPKIRNLWVSGLFNLGCLRPVTCVRSRRGGFSVYTTLLS